ncbi:MAG: AzlC family ABC transporter permease [Lachnospiraceae bacterium]|nr:AzlC family ABC transporter permease [Lachnospiraceae bacterium]
MGHKRGAEFAAGFRDGIPIGLGYLAVSFTLGIQCRDAGLSLAQATVMSLVNLTSAGEFAAIGVIGVAGSYIELIVGQFIINLRYMLMSFALSQKVEPGLSIGHRLGIAFGVTDEIFGVSVGRPDRLSPFYSYGAMTPAIPGWTIGTALGVIVGDVLPGSIVNALSLALYGMFLAIIVPKAKEDRHVALACLLALVLSCLFTYLPGLKLISGGSRVIILTLLVSGLAALVWPVKEEKEAEHA